jgi:hypothetical protein
MGLLYDSSLMADDDCYELLLDGQPTGVVELPVEWIRDDAVYFNMNRFAALRPYTPPSAVLEIFRREFDAAYAEGGLFQLTMHPHIIGHRSRMMILEGAAPAHPGERRHLVRDARRRRALRQAEGLNHGERQRRQGMKRTILAVLAAIAAASAPVVPARRGRRANTCTPTTAATTTSIRTRSSTSAAPRRASTSTTGCIAGSTIRRR